MLLQGQLLEQLLFPISCSFWVLSLSLIFCRGTAVYITGAFKRIYLKHQTFGKAVHVFQNITCSRTFLKLVCHFFLKRGIAAGHSFFQTYWLLFEDQREPSILSCRVFFFTEQLPSYILSRLLYLFDRHLAAIHSFGGYMEQIISNSNYLSITATFLEEIRQSIFLNCSHLLFERHCVYFYGRSYSHPLLE